jgi:IS5 family transposase
MFKILILQAWYGLSDEALEKQIAKDLMFRRFIDLSLSENMPDHSSIWRFRQLLNTEQLLKPLLEQINTHLEQNSIIISLGSINIIDATVIEAKQSRKRKDKDGNNTYRNTPLTDKQKQDNKQRSSIRYIVKRTFGLLKLHHGLGKARYLGLERNKTRAQLITMSHNLKTGMNIFKEMQRLKGLKDCCVQ